MNRKNVKNIEIKERSKVVVSELLKFDFAKITGSFLLNEGLTKHSLFDKKEPVIFANENHLSYLIFYIEYISEKHSISYEKLLMLLYLKELQLFPMDFKIHNRSVRLPEYLASGLIVADSLNNKKVYKLSNKSLDIIKQFGVSFNDNNSLLLKNRVTDVDLDSKVASVLTGMF